MTAQERRNRKRCGLVLFVGALVIGCGGISPQSGQNPATESNSTGSQSGANPTGNSGSATSTASGTAICNEMKIEAQTVAPNLLLVVDLSGSMKSRVSALDPSRKIDVAATAIQKLLDLGAGKIRFGWMQYPGPADECAAGQVDVECGDNTTATISQKLNPLSTVESGRTPTAESLQMAAQSPSLADKTRSNFIMLVTDGMPNCTGGFDGSVAALNSLRTTNKVDTFVIGLGDEVNGQNAQGPVQLNAMAEAGGRPRAGVTKYYPANSLDELQKVFQDIGGMVMSCTVTTNPAPDFPDYLWVYFDGQPLKRDPAHQDGFDYDPANKQLNFFGPPCDLMKAGKVAKVEVKMGCSPPD